MAVHRTREQKLQAQARREVQRYSWTESSAGERSHPDTKKKLGPSQSLPGGPMARWLLADLRNTLLATLTVIILLIFFVWQAG